MFDDSIDLAEETLDEDNPAVKEDPFAYIRQAKNPSP